MNIPFLSFLAQATSEDRVEYWIRVVPALLDRVGFPVIVVGLLSWFFVMFLKWATPKLDACIAAWVRSKDAMTESYKETTKIVSKLSEEMQRIQLDQHHTLIELKNGLIQVCKHSQCSLSVGNQISAASQGKKE
jgi:hypothetical protein